MTNNNSGNYAVIDTETTWSDEVMSIGIVVADSTNNEAIAAKYYIVIPTYKKGGMYSNVLNIIESKQTIMASREDIISDIHALFSRYNVSKILAYNAKFDYNHLPELHNYCWCDIMRIAAYKQYNSSIPTNIECCKTGRIKSGYGVEPIYQYLSGEKKYREMHNALTDAIDELKIVEMLGYNIKMYDIGQI